MIEVNSYLVSYYKWRTARRDRAMRSLNGYKFVRGGYEYRLGYSGGFAPCIFVDRRAVGKRNFKCTSIHVNPDEYATANEAVAAICMKIDEVAV